MGPVDSCWIVVPCRDLEENQVILFHLKSLTLRFSRGEKSSYITEVENENVDKNFRFDGKDESRPKQITNEETEPLIQN